MTILIDMIIEFPEEKSLHTYESLMDSLQKIGDVLCPKHTSLTSAEMRYLEIRWCVPTERLRHFELIRKAHPVARFQVVHLSVRKEVSPQN